MSRIGKLPIAIPTGVNVTVDNNHVKVKGKLGELDHVASDEVVVTIEDGHIIIKPKKLTKEGRAMWGLTRTLVANLVKGVSVGYTTKLEINGVGYRAAVDKKYLTLFLGYSHEIKIFIPKQLTVKCEKPTSIEIFGASKKLVGDLASRIRSLRKPEPYKGKGIKYEGEVILRKEGKKK